MIPSILHCVRCGFSTFKVGAEAKKATIKPVQDASSRPQKLPDAGKDEKPKTKPAQCRYNYACCLCKVTAQVRAEMDSHMASKKHKQLMKQLVELCPNGETVSSFLQTYMDWRNARVAKLSVVVNRPLEGHPTATSSDPNKKAEAALDAALEATRVVWCHACRVHVPYVSKCLKEHMYSELHITNRKVTMKERTTNVVDIVKSLMQLPKSLALLESFKKGKDPFTNVTAFIEEWEFNPEDNVKEKSVEASAKVVTREPGSSGQHQMPVVELLKKRSQPEAAHSSAFESAKGSIPAPVNAEKQIKLAGNEIDLAKKKRPHIPAQPSNVKKERLDDGPDQTSYVKERINVPAKPSNVKERIDVPAKSSNVKERIDVPAKPSNVKKERLNDAPAKTSSIAAAAAAASVTTAQKEMANAHRADVDDRADGGMGEGGGVKGDIKGDLEEEGIVVLNMDEDFQLDDFDDEDYEAGEIVHIMAGE
ncbi:uncharacterized protein LOC144948426 isoform X3 [Lampetra fluviatilis]